MPVLAASLALAACGDDEGSPGAATTATTKTPTTGAQTGRLALTEVPDRAPRAVSRGAVAPEATAGARSVSYCSPSGDYCLGIQASSGAALLSIATFAFRGSYRLCINGPGERGCQSFALRRQRGRLYGSTVRYRPTRTGRYAASWFTGATKLGRTLFFRVS